MAKLRILSFLSLFCILHKCEVLNATSTEEDKGTHQTTNKVCLTRACKDAATTIQESIDPKVKPCDNFYKFACGNFLKTAVIPKDNTQADRYTSIQIKFREQLKKSIAEPIQPKDPRWMRQTKNFYKACMDTKAIEKNSVSTELRKLKKAGGWPVLENKWYEKSFDWKQTIYAMRKVGYHIWFLFDFVVGAGDKSNINKVLLNINQPPFYIGRERILKGIKHPIVIAYYNLMVEVAVIFGANKTRAENELKDSLDFEIKLATIAASEESKNNVPAKPMKVWELEKKYPIIPWKQYFNKILESIVVIGDYEVIMVHVPTYFDKLEQLLKTTSKRTLANFLAWKAVEMDLDYLNEKIVNEKVKFLDSISPSYKKGDRSQECLKMTTDMLEVSTGALYVRKNINPETKKSAEKLAVDIEQQWKNMVKEADWMDEETRRSALAKLDSLKYFIGYPKDVSEDKTLDEYYSTVEITPNDYVQSVSNLMIFNSNSSFKDLREPLNKFDWKRHINIFHENSGSIYFPLENSMDYSAGILQGVFYDNDRPQYLNYAGIGAFDLGPEITRVFDNRGRHYDENGILKDWWSPETYKKFLQKATCLIQQYNNYNVEGTDRKLDGIGTRDSNIADNGGVKAAYLAYQNLVKQKGPEPKLPGLNYSQSQLFWIQAAVTQCAKYTPQAMKSVIPPELRIIGAFSNRPEFETDFGCSHDSKMNPVKKCSVF